MLKVFPFLAPIAPCDGPEEIHPWDQVLFETDNFVVVPTVGALVEGWLLVVARNSYLCMGAIDQNALRELEQLIGLLTAALQDCYGEIAIFEHGPSNGGTCVGCGVDHAHLHLLPAPGSLLDGVSQVSAVRLQWHSADGLATAADYFNSGKPYLYLEQPVGRAMIADAGSAPSQLFRRVVAYQMGSPEKFDWRSHTMESNVVSTVERVTRWISTEHDRTGHLQVSVP